MSRTSQMPLGCQRSMTEGQSIGGLTTVDRHGRPHTSVVSWFRSLDARTCAIAVDRRSRHYENISRENPRVSLLFFCDTEIFSIAGTARVALEEMQYPPFPMASIHVDVDLVVDQTLPDVEFAGPRYRYSERKAHRATVEEAILAELRAGHYGYVRRPEVVTDSRPGLHD
ncbi:pyridoxamine 5'-phosphate oxidase family protein [Pseudonocardia bannensis]|uniref:Pyridoxamine 5'-phosphate oxidase N-terminal domain-containing protein n=1 Tax=Pseudonocardia bannensis TaxID=630973 RepID=A0A848DCT5_9PSEU|nr:pyridoxamine 5'-phosphate oxidase family protein [Pseudonocardia bannensis]NMH90393.1 hypothetical protein [Pseudonocardia bannensis]